MSNNIYFDSFDEIFYNKNYNISSSNDKNFLFQHWIDHGKQEDYVINKNQLKSRLKLNISHNNRLLDLLSYEPNNSIEFNILIRTSQRPTLFRRCIESVFNQKFKGKVNIYISYDTPDTFKYLSKYKNVNIVGVNKTNNYGFNLYCNTLMGKIKNGWIIFLDDDDMFISDNTLDIISSHISSNTDLIIWNYLRPDKIISPKDNFVKGELDTTCFCFNSIYKNNSIWINKRCSDFYFFKKLDENTNFTKKYVNLALVKTIFEESVASHGLKL